jgi:hypothetical protein
MKEYIVMSQVESFGRKGAATCNNVTFENEESVREYALEICGSLGSGESWKVVSVHDSDPDGDGEICAYQTTTKNGVTKTKEITRRTSKLPT